VKRKAQTVNLGTSSNLTSLVTVPTITQVLSSFPDINLLIREREIGALCNLDWHSLFEITSANLEPVLLAKKLHNNIRIKIS
jgi:hypothetical protein